MRTLSPGVALAVVAVALPACSEVESGGGTGYEPATVEHVREGVERVTFTQEGALRTGLKTADVARLRGQLVVPYESLIYDGKGTSHVYRVRAPLTFERVEIAVDRIEGDDVLLRSGPPAGSAVVTVGAAEVWGTELGIAGGH